MADNIREAFAALGARWEAIFAREQARFVAVSLDLPVTLRDAGEASRVHFQQAVAGLVDDRSMRDAVHDPAYLAMMAGRSIGYDGPDDVRISQEIGPSPGSLEAVMADLQLAEHLAREAQHYDDEHPAVFERIESLQSRLDGLAQDTQTPHQERQHDQGMGYEHG